MKVMMILLLLIVIHLVVQSFAKTPIFIYNDFLLYIIN